MRPGPPQGHLNQIEASVSGSLASSSEPCTIAEIIAAQSADLAASKSRRRCGSGPRSPDAAGCHDCERMCKCVLSECACARAPWVGLGRRAGQGKEGRMRAGVVSRATEPCKHHGHACAVRTRWAGHGGSPCASSPCASMSCAIQGRTRAVGSVASAPVAVLPTAAVRTAAAPATGVRSSLTISPAATAAAPFT